MKYLVPTLNELTHISEISCRFLSTASSGRAETVPGGSAWRTSRRPFPPTPRAASGSG